jgi:DNA mismatch endonuclease (patch repair protein)
MADRITSETRSRNMAAIRGSNTKPELIVRHFLHACGFRFRLHRKDLPGKLDIVLPKYRAVIFVHGCFWHLHGCKNTIIPKTRTEWWTAKLAGNRARDERNRLRLEELGWRGITVWECETTPAKLDRLADIIPTQQTLSRHV